MFYFFAIANIYFLFHLNIFCTSIVKCGSRPPIKNRESYGSLIVLLTIFQVYHGGKFYWCGKLMSVTRENKTCYKILYTSLQV